MDLASDSHGFVLAINFGIDFRIKPLLQRSKKHAISATNDQCAVRLTIGETPSQLTGTERTTDGAQETWKATLRRSGRTTAAVNVMTIGMTRMALD